MQFEQEDSLILVGLETDRVEYKVAERHRPRRLQLASSLRLVSAPQRALCRPVAAISCRPWWKQVKLCDDIQGFSAHICFQIPLSGLMPDARIPPGYSPLTTFHGIQYPGYNR